MFEGGSQYWELSFATVVVAMIILTLTLMFVFHTIRNPVILMLDAKFCTCVRFIVL